LAERPRQHDRPAAAARAPRNIYLDLGANWADTLDLHRRIADDGHKRLQNWEVYAFEISPTLIPYVDKYVRFLNGFDKRPAACVAPISESKMVYKFAPAVGCLSKDPKEAKTCFGTTTAKAVRGFLKSAKPAMVAPVQVHTQLAMAAYPLEPDAVQPRYTFIPAGAGGVAGSIKFGGGKRVQDSDIGDESVKHIAGHVNLVDGGEPLTVQIIDFPKWVAEHFSKDDYIVMKIDIEGAEFALLEKMAKLGLLDMVDQLALECHPWSGDCKQLDALLRAGGVRSILYDGKDYVSKANVTQAVEQYKQDWLSRDCEPFRS